MQRSTVFFFIVALVVGFILFKVKYEVVDIEVQLAETVKQIEQEKGNIHILKAEWSHLNEPQRLQKLAEKYLDIIPIKTEQISAVIQDTQEEEKASSVHLASMKGEE
jgi:cell division protein FtsL